MRVVPGALAANQWPQTTSAEICCALDNAQTPNGGCAGHTHGSQGSVGVGSQGCTGGGGGWGFNRLPRRLLVVEKALGVQGLGVTKRLTGCLGDGQKLWGRNRAVTPKPPKRMPRREGGRPTGADGPGYCTRDGWR